MSGLSNTRIKPYLQSAVTLGFLLLWVLLSSMVWVNWRNESQFIETKIRSDADAALQSKALEIEGILKRTYHTIRTISLLPGVRVSPPDNRSSADQDVVATGRMTLSDFETVQQLYNHIAASVSVSEIYIVHDGFRPDLGQVPFVMFDQVVVDRIARATAIVGGKQASPDIPEQDESEEYADYVRQLEYFRQNSPEMPLDGLDSIYPVNSGLMRTCDNSQYTSVQHGDARNARGFSMSVPIFDLNSHRFKGLVTAVIRSNVLEAVLVGLPMLPITENEKKALLIPEGATSLNEPTNFILENEASGIRIHDRRNAFLSQVTSDTQAVAHQSQIRLKLAGTPSWVLANYVSQAKLHSELAPGRLSAIGQFSLLSLLLGLFWLSVSTMLKRQQLATQQIRTLADELEMSAENHSKARTEFQATLDAIPDLMFELGLDGNLYDCNSRNADPLVPKGLPFLGKTVYETMPPALAAAFLTCLTEANATELSTSRQCELSLAQGNRWFELSVSPKTTKEGTMPRFVALVRDITNRKVAEEQIQNLAFYDPLTRLPNRRLLMDRLKQAMTTGARRQNSGALLFVDLDHFKTLNDTMGHDMGDLLLQQVAQRLTACIREGDTVARLGGDEFVVMLEDLSDDAMDAATQVEAVGTKILAALSQAYQFTNYTHHSSASIGVTLFGNIQENIEEPMKRADLAMYQAKAAGRNTLRFFDAQMQAVVSAHAEIQAGLREALAKDQFELHYQVQVTGLGQVTGAEALVRWNHPERGKVSPAEFIPLAEDSGLIVPLGRWVLETACVQLAKWENVPDLAQMTISVNVSPRQFNQKDFVEQVETVLAQTKASPKRLKIELTEGLLVTNIEEVINKMNELKAIGVGFSLDDFGTGYSSLSHLKLLPLDQLKIDQGFVRDILTDPNDEAIAKMVVALADSMSLNVIAEGVETVEQRECLARLGCHAFQGYLFGRPMAVDDFETAVKRE